MAALLPALAFAAPAASVSALLARLTADAGPRQFSLQATIMESPLGDTTSVSVRGKMQGAGTGAIAHGTVSITSEGKTMRLRMAMLEQTLYLKLSKAGDSEDALGVEDDLGVDPWITVDLGQGAEQLAGSADLSILDSFFAIQSAAGNGQGGTNYTIGLVPRPALALSQLFGGEWSVLGGTQDALDLRRADGWIRDAVTLAAHIEETASGRAGASDFSVSVADDLATFSVSGSSSPLAQSFTLVKPLLTVPLEEVLADENLPGDWSGLLSGAELFASGPEAMPEGCTAGDVRRGTCPAAYQSRRLLGR
jgi:hypothetical protein